MTNLWQTLHATEVSLLSAMIYYVHSVVLICQPFLSYHLTLLVAFVSIPCCFFIISNCLEMEKSSFGSHYWNHFLFVAAHLSTICESNNNKKQDFARGKLMFFLGILFLSLYTIFIWYQHQQRSDSSEDSNAVPLLIEISFSFVGNGIAMIGRWFIPRDNFLWLMMGAVTMFSIGVVFFYYYPIYSENLRSHSQLLQESDSSVNWDSGNI